MAKEKRYWYEVIFQVDLKYGAPDQRRERWKQQGRSLIQPAKTAHWQRVYPSKGTNARGELMPPDYVVFNRPAGKHLTEEITKNVSRSLHDGTNPGQFGKRAMRPKITKPKLRLLDADEVTESVRRSAYDLEWDETLFEDATGDVQAPGNIPLAAQV